MKITQIEVNGLFGIFDHVIPLNTDERITIIHGLNGFGKTNIIRILDGIFNSKYSILEKIPFDNFIVKFDNKSYIRITRNSSFKNTYDNNQIITLDFCSEKSDIKTYNFFNRKRRRRKASEIKNVSSIDLPAYLNLEWRDIRDIFEYEQLLNYPPSEIISRKELENEPDWLQELQSNINIRLIESQRLLNIDNSDSSSMLPTVSTYSKEIAALMKDKLAEYSKISQSLDRTFPVRAVKQQADPNLTDQQLREELNELETIRSRLVEVGLLDQEENQDFPIQPEDIDESARSILSVYVEDVKQKLSIFDEIARKIDLLRTIINRKFAYSYKEMNFSKEHGFVFTTCYPDSAKYDPKTLSPTDLSSGEQHELVLLYELLFKVKPNSLVLIDEPELSLHVGWQSQFLKDLQEITKLADVDILMATHSPDIIQDRWDDLTVELKAPDK